MSAELTPHQKGEVRRIVHAVHDLLEGHGVSVRRAQIREKARAHVASGGTCEEFLAGVRDRLA